MGDFFGGLRSGIQFPQVVMNQGPLPGAGGLPQPLHEAADARINYGSSLLGNLTPYAYGEPGYLSSQNAYLNIPHKIQKIVPVVFLPEAKNPARELVDLSHPIDDGDLAFSMRLDRKSMFCTGLSNTSMRRAGLGTAIDPFINLCTLNYILSGMQLGINGNDTGNLWLELLDNLNHSRFGRQGESGRDFGNNPVNLNDIIHVIRHCIRPFGVTRGSEKQGGQDEATISPATWPVSFVVSLTIDGKESNVLNIWHNHELSAGDDLVLRLKLMPIRPYTLNHYYKGVKRQGWDMRTLPPGQQDRTHVWQLVPDLLTLEPPDKNDMQASTFANLPAELRSTSIFRQMIPAVGVSSGLTFTYGMIWQELGFWHIGRSQVLTRKYGDEEYWHNDLANSLRTNHLDITLQPVFQMFPSNGAAGGRGFQEARLSAEPVLPTLPPVWQPVLGLERLGGAELPAMPAVMPAPLAEEEPDWLGRLEFADEEPVPEPPAKRASTGKPAKRGKAIGGSLLRADGSSEPSMVGML
jgi:hypothetical protein